MYPIKVETRPGRGKVVVATKDMPPGQIALACSLAAVYPMQPEIRCNFCFSPPQEQKLMHCTACKKARYCSAACQKADWLNHKFECAHLKGWLGGLALPDMVTLIILARLQRGKGLRSSESDPVQPLHVYKHTWKDVVGMVSDTSGRLDEHFKMMIKAARDRGFVAPSSTGSNAGADDRHLDDDAALRLLNTFDSNNFGVVDEIMALRASACAPVAALLNHSCRPNVTLGFCSETELNVEYRLNSEGDSMPTLEEFESLDADALPPPMKAKHILVFRALQPIKAGEELCHSYVDQMMLTEQRRDYLRRVYGFHCDCPACVAGEDPSHPNNTSRLSLAAAQPGKGPYRVGVIKASPAGEGAGADEDDIESDVDSLEPEVKADILRAQSIMAAAEVASAKPEALSSIHGLDLTSRKDDGELIKRAGATRMLAPADCFEILREIRALEIAVSVLLTWLHPLHMQVVTALNMLSERYMSIGDDRAAIAVSEHLVALYRHVYAMVQGKPVSSSSSTSTGVDSSSSPAAAGALIHPMLSLQLFTLGDLYSSLAQDTQAVSERRAAELAALFKEMDTSSLVELDHAGAMLRPVSLCTLPRSGDAVRAWLARAQSCYAECVNGLRITHGPVAGITMDGEERLQNIRSLVGKIGKA